MRRIRDVRSSLAVYVVTSSGLVPGRGHVEVAQAALRGGATAVQLRAPELEDDPHELVELATRTWSYCQQADVPLIVNNALYAAFVADGVHLGQSDQLEGIRKRLGTARIIGVSVETPDQAHVAWGEGADYLGVTVFPTATKPEATPVGLGGLHEISAATPLPVVGIGGIDASNARDVLAAGAAGVAVISAVGAALDPVATTRELVQVVRDYLREQNSGSN